MTWQSERGAGGAGRRQTHPLADEVLAAPQGTGGCLVAGRAHGDLLFERYRYPPGPAGITAPHVHGSHQLCLSVDFVGEYRLGAAVHGVPVGSFSLVPPGQVHASRDPVDRARPATFLVAYLPPELPALVAADLHASARPPVFPAAVFIDPLLGARFAALHAAVFAGAPPLEADERLLSAIAGLVLRHGEVPRDAPRAGREHRATATARAYLHAHADEPVRLADLARAAGLSPFRLAHAFRAEIGLPPHAYHLAVRVERARLLLAQGWSATRTASETGFCDQSHLTRHFRRVVGVAPGSYARKDKNVQAVPRAAR